MTPRVLERVVAPVTSRVPAAAVFPVLCSTVNLFVATRKVLATSKVFCNVVAFVTVRVFDKVVASVTRSVPSTAVLPV